MSGDFGASDHRGSFSMSFCTCKQPGHRQCPHCNKPPTEIGNFLFHIDRCHRQAERTGALKSMPQNASHQPTS